MIFHVHWYSLNDLVALMTWLYNVYKKRLVFEIQISHNYSDLIVLKCVELMYVTKTCLIYERDQSVMSHK